MHEAIIQIKERSPILNDMLSNGEIGVVGGMYNIETGVVLFQEIEMH